MQGLPFRVLEVQGNIDGAFMKWLACQFAAGKAKESLRRVDIRVPWRAGESNEQLITCIGKLLNQCSALEYVSLSGLRFTSCRMQKVPVLPGTPCFHVCENVCKSTVPSCLQVFAEAVVTV
jgi:hypothetical protein